MKKLLTAVIALTMALILLVGCGTAKEPAPAVTPEPAPADASDTKKEPEATAEPEETESPADDVPEAGPIDGMINPWTEYASLDDLCEDHPGFELDELPNGATDILYRVLEEPDRTLYEIQFRLDKGEFTYRLLPSTEPVADVTEISGAYGPWDTDESGTQLLNGVTYPYAKQFNKSEMRGNIYLFDPEEDMCYDLSSLGIDLETLMGIANGMFYSEVQTSTVSGSVLSFTDSELKLLADNLNTLVFHPYIKLSLHRGDYVTVTYAGSFSSGDEPEVTAVDVIESSHTFSGTVTKHDENSVTVAAGSGAVITFMLAGHTEITGEENVIKNNATVTVTYAGDIAEYPTAFEVDVVVPGDELDPELIDKTLTGSVIKLSKKSITIKTSKGKKWTFVRTSDTLIDERKGDLELNATVKITYDGYASDQPNAKKIQVTASAPEPTPVPTHKPDPDYYNVEGYVKSVNGIWIVLEEDGKTYTVNAADCVITGAENLMPGAYAELVYYKEGSKRICIVARFSTPLDF